MLNKSLWFWVSWFALVLIFGCSREEISEPEVTIPIQAAETKSRILFQQSMPLVRVESAGEALGTWRQYSGQKPTLLLLSNEPMLARLPDSVWPEVSRVIVLGTQVELARAVTPESPSPLLLPAMTLDAALRLEWFSKVVWALPIRDLTQGLDLAVVSQQLQENRLLNQEEIASLAQVDEVVTGQVRGVPLLIGPLANLSDLNKPAVVHIDQSYFQNLYKNEIATPLLPLVMETLSTLRKMEIPVLAVTFTYGNLSERISLDVRFLGEVLTAVVERPEIHNEPQFKNWQRQGTIFYLNNFFKKEKVMETALVMEQEDPGSAWVQFTLYRAAAENRQGTEALRYLAAAVERDNIYALEYLSLSKRAHDSGLPDEAMRMLALAGKALPENPFIKLEMAQLALNMEDKETALQLVEQLQRLEWSTVFYPEMPQYLAGFTAYLKSEEVSSPQKLIKDPRRQRILK